MNRFHYTPDSEWPVPVTEPAAPQPSPFDALKAYTGTATLMRLAGALAVITSMSAFLLQDWTGGSDTQRFYLLLAQTLLLAGGGFGLAFLMQENKGARVFFGLALLSVSANMATLGALVFSVTQWGGGLAAYPGFARWQADPAMLGLALAAGVAVSAPVAWFGHRVMARSSATLLSGLFLFANLLLLLPVRESLPVGAVALLGMAVPLWFLRKRMAEDPALRTPEGYFALATLFVPALIVLTRSLWLYQTDMLLKAMLGMMVFVLLRTASPLVDAASRVRSVMDWASLLAALSTAFWLSIAAASPIHAGLDDYVLLATFGVSFTAMAMELARRAGPRRKAFAFIAAGMLAAVGLLALADENGALACLTCIAAGGVVFLIGRWSSQRALLVLGAATSSAGLALQVHDLVTLADFPGWVTLAALGVSAIVAASVLERHGAALKARWSALAAPATPKDDA